MSHLMFSIVFLHHVGVCMKVRKCSVNPYPLGAKQGRAVHQLQMIFEWVSGPGALPLKVGIEWGLRAQMLEPD